MNIFGVGGGVCFSLCLALLSCGTLYIKINLINKHVPSRGFFALYFVIAFIFFHLLFMVEPISIVLYVHGNLAAFLGVSDLFLVFYGLQTVGGPNSLYANSADSAAGGSGTNPSGDNAVGSGTNPSGDNVAGSGTNPSGDNVAGSGTNPPFDQQSIPTMYPH